MTQTHPTQPQIAADDATGPIIALKRDGLSTREIAARVHLSQSTVQRRLSQFYTMRRAQFWRTVLYAIFAACAVLTTAAVCTIAWH